MNRKTLAQAGGVALALALVTVACTPDGGTGHVASASDAAATARDAALAGRTRAALARKDGKAAVRLAERLVASAPDDAGYRMLLGQSYLADGRFASAERAFRDTLSLAPDQPRAAFDLALTEIAQGRDDDARATLAAVDGRLPVSDTGLALALAGDRATAIERLSGLVRSGGSDARARQNLALAFALDGRWREARGVAMQDTPADRIGDQIERWAALAQSGSGATRVAALLGVTPAIGDPGQPQQLALAAPTAARPVALALAEPAPEPAPPAAPAGVTVPLDAAPPAAPVALAAAAPAAPAMPDEPMPIPMPAPAAMPTPAATPAPVAATPRLLRVAMPAPAAPMPAAHRIVQPGRFADARESGFVVQLGAYARAGAIDDAWAQASRLSPRVATFSPVRGQTRFGNAALVRLSVIGFATRAEAASLCTVVKARGGDCFVRAASGDAPLQWVRREARDAQVAMRRLPAARG